MAIPLLIDTDMGIDDAAAVMLALASQTTDVRAIVAVGGNVPIALAADNIRRLLAAFAPARMPLIGAGLDQRGDGLMDRREAFGRDGLGESHLTFPAAPAAQDFRAVYRQAIEAARGELHVLALGPLSNLAALLDESPALAKSIRHIALTGGAVWTKGDATETSEFNFHRDPAAAAKVLDSGLPITVCPLDVTRFVCLDESHVAHLAASGHRMSEALAGMLRYPLSRDVEPGLGKTYLADALTVGSLLWPDLFLKTRMRLELVIGGPEAGRAKPALGGDATRRVDLLTAVNAVDFLENMLESLCREAFVV